MRRSSDETRVHPASSASSTTRQNHLRWSFVPLFYFLSLFLVSSVNYLPTNSQGNRPFSHSLSTGRYHRPTGIYHMRSAQSATRIATATVALFRRFNTVSSFRPLPIYPVFSKGGSSETTRPSHNRLLRSQSPQFTKESIDRKSILQRHLSTRGETEDKHQKSSSFAVPDMGTGVDNDGSNATSKYTGYEKWVRRLYATNMFHPVKLGLENMHLLHELLGSPMDDVSMRYSSVVQYAVLVLPSF